MPISKPPKTSQEADAGVGHRLKEERERLQWSADKAAEIGGVSRTAQYNYEGGTSAPDTSYLLRVRDEGLDALYVITGMRERRTPDVTPEERELLDTYNSLPPKLREFVDKALCLSRVAYLERPDYDYGTAHAATGVVIKRNKVGGHIAGRDLNITAPAKKPKR